MATVKKTKGRQKVEMAKMSKESNLQVTFSKRRVGVFKKASELCTLCGAETAVIAFSPGKKVYSFGHPSVETVVDRFLTRNPLRATSTLHLCEADRSTDIHELNMDLTLTNKALEVEKKRGEALEILRKESQEQCWWARPVDELSLEQLEHLKLSLEALKKDVQKQISLLAPNSMGEVMPLDQRIVGSNPLCYSFGFHGPSF